MDKNQVIEILNSKGYSAHDTNGILYIDLEDIGASSINKMRTLLSQLHYYNSWGIKKVQAGVLAATNRTLDLTDEFDYSADHEKESAGHENDLINLEKESVNHENDFANSEKDSSDIEKDADIYGKVYVYSENSKEKPEDRGPENIINQNDYTEEKLELKSDYGYTSEKETSSNSEDDDMMFDENSPFEQVSLFDMMN